MPESVSVLHVIQWLSRGGASRAMWGTAKHTVPYGNYRHYVTSLMPPEAEAVALIENAGLIYVPTYSHKDILALYERMDIVQIEWWNTPQMDAFLREPQPAARMLFWYHVQGHTDPQYISNSVVAMADIAVASSPVCKASPAFNSLSSEGSQKKLRLVYDAADFDRLKNIKLKPHQGFNVGFIGTLSFIKMHPQYISMSAAVKPADIQFVICGSDNLDVLRGQAAAHHSASRFKFRGYVEDIQKEIENFDVYGYPLCEDTYASAELNLQEVMYAGIPPVVFPYGGVKELVINDFTGLVVHSEAEYTRAIEFLYHNPEERMRLGRNAAEYARQIFGAENAAKKFDSIYQELLERPKIKHSLVADSDRKNGSVSYSTLESYYPKLRGTLRFVDSLGSFQSLFLEAVKDNPLLTQLEYETQIAGLSTLMRDCGINWFRDFYPEDPYLNLWAGVAALKAKNYQIALTYLLKSIEAGIGRTHVFYYATVAAEMCSLTDIAETFRAELGKDPETEVLVTYLDSPGAQTLESPL